jgi:hypothetical protein
MDNERMYKIGIERDHLLSVLIVAFLVKGEVYHLGSEVDQRGELCSNQ